MKHDRAGLFVLIPLGDCSYQTLVSFLFFVVHLLLVACVGGFVQFLYICHLIIFFIKDSISRRDRGDLLMLLLAGHKEVFCAFMIIFLDFHLLGYFFCGLMSIIIYICFFYCFCVCGDVLLFFVSFFCRVSVSTMSPKIWADYKYNIKFLKKIKIGLCCSVFFLIVGDVEYNANCGMD